MTFLILKIFAYLFVAAAIGAAAGWLFRNLEAQKSEEKANRAAHDAKSKVPQLESLLRGRDEQITKFKGQLDEAKSVLSEREQAVRQLESQLRDTQREADRWQASAEAKGPNQSLDDMDFEADTDIEADSGADELISELSREIADLKASLAMAKEDVRNAQVQLEVVRTAQTGASNGADEGAEAAQWRDQVQALQGQLERETAKVLELERERELQNKSLKVLHQQLELERHKATG